MMRKYYCLCLRGVGKHCAANNYFCYNDGPRGRKLATDATVKRNSFDSKRDKEKMPDFQM